MHTQIQHIDVKTQCAVSEEAMVTLADSMASAAVSFSAHGYDQFIFARELFKYNTHQLFEYIRSIER